MDPRDAEHVLSSTTMWIGSGIEIKKGAKVLLVIHEVLNPGELAFVREKLEEWAPEADWCVLCGPIEVVHKPAGDQ